MPKHDYELKEGKDGVSSLTRVSKKKAIEKAKKKHKAEDKHIKEVGIDN